MSAMLNKLQAKIDNKQSELNQLYAERGKLETLIARREGELEGLRTAQSVASEQPAER